MAATPLLHVADSLDTVTTVDWRIVALAIVLFPGALCAIWRPIMRRRTRRRAATTVITALAFLAVLPSVLPYDHMLPAHQAHAAEESGFHASHCHDTPGSCADAPLAAGPGQFLSTNALLIDPLLAAFVLMLAVPVLHGLTRRPPIPPPLAARISH